MSKISLQPNASGNGTFSIVAPDSNTNRTLTLPDESGAVIAADASTGQLASSNMPAGSVIQVVSTTKTNAFTTTSSSYVDIPDLSINITPKISGSDIFIVVTVGMVGGTTAGSEVLFSVFKNSVDLTNDLMSGFVNGARMSGPNAGSFLDENVTDSATTYSLRARKSGGGELRLHELSAASTITVMEIAG